MTKFFYLISGLLAAGALGAQEVEDFHVELTMSAWLMNTSGTIQSGILPVDLQSDLGIEQRKPGFAGRIVFKPARRQRIVVEGVPYRLTGENTLHRQISFAGRTYTLQDQVSSTADINYVSAAYQYDLVSRPRGHFGLLGGVAYVDAAGTVTSRTLGLSGTETQSFPFPVAGAEFRVFPIRGRGILNFNGEVKGMSLGSYGHFVETSIHAGIGAGRHVTIEAGYQLVDADVHRKDETRGITPRFSGPIFSLQFRD